MPLLILDIMIFSAVIRAVSGLITPAPPIFILSNNHTIVLSHDISLSNNHTIVLSHDISCVCMHPAMLPLLHLTGGAAGCVIVAGIKNQVTLEKCQISRSFQSVCLTICLY